MHANWKITPNYTFMSAFKLAERVLCLIPSTLMLACRDAALDQELGPYPFKRNQWCKQTVLCTVLRVPSRAKDKTLSNFADQREVCVPPSQDSTELQGRTCRSSACVVLQPGLRVLERGHRGGPEELQTEWGQFEQPGRKVTLRAFL